MLHELGHCAMALDHVNRVWDAMGDGFWEITSFTLSANAGVQVKPPGLDEGRDMIRGSSDDFHHGIGGDPVADSVSWFRKSDNDPFVIDVTVIDINSYSRSVTNDLPPGHTWAANANRLVGELLEYTDSQAVMYTPIIEPRVR